MTAMSKLLNWVLVLSILSMIPRLAFGQKRWDEINTTQELYDSYPEVIRHLLKSLDFDRPALKQVMISYQKGDAVAACDQLLGYYLTSSTREGYKITKDFDFASGSFNQFVKLEVEATHYRSVMYVRDDFWVIVERILTDRPRNLNILWHWHPDLKVI